MATQNDEKLSATDKVYNLDDSVNFKMEYPKDYKKKKHHKDGEVLALHPLMAADFEAKGLGKIVK